LKSGFPLGILSKKEHVIVVLDDITERKQAEEKLKQFNSELHNLSCIAKHSGK